VVPQGQSSADCLFGSEVRAGKNGEKKIMANEIVNKTNGHTSPFERIKRTNDAGMEFWSSRDFSEVLGYGDYRNFEGVIEKAKMACFNSGYRIEDHFVDVTDMILTRSQMQIIYLQIQEGTLHSVTRKGMKPDAECQGVPQNLF
jgi:hypothetical protein